MSVLTVKNLTKEYPSFVLDNVNIELEKGAITGFIGRNGAGKTTFLKSILNFLHFKSGEVFFFDKSFAQNESEIKQKLGYVGGAVGFYNTKKLSTITKITRSFYDNWDESSYQKYLALFKLDEKKTPAQLSQGMKIKYALALALSHNAELLILDEPTSGLDPISRDELLDVFLRLQEEGKSIFFSTHIVSDLEKCADNIIYIHNGKILYDGKLKAFRDTYRFVQFSEKTNGPTDGLIGIKREKEGYSALVRADNGNDVGRAATLEEIIVHLEKEADND